MADPLTPNKYLCFEILFEMSVDDRFQQKQHNMDRIYSNIVFDLFEL